jgi:nickel/cobalt transporter (NicO) family protein
VIGRLTAAAVVGLTALLLLPAPAQAHPLGNFTTNQYAGLRVSSAGVDVDYVLDLAELPAHQAKNDEIDTNADGAESAAENSAYATRTCAAARAASSVTVDGRPLALADRAGRVTFPPARAG